MNEQASLHTSAATLSELELQLARAERQLQVEAALERVRARAMSMRHSEDILSVTGAMFDEYRNLGIPAVRCGIGIVHDITDGETWTTSYTPDGATVQMTGHVSFLESPVYRGLYDAWVRQESWYRFELAGENLRRFLSAVFPEFDLPGFSDTFPERQVINFFGFLQGGLYLVSPDDLSEENGQVLQRFAEVFHLTYTRYQDLKQTEEQILQANRQASLDRVRAEIASMRTAEDLQRITPLVWRELTSLGVPFFRCGVLIMDDASQKIQAFVTNPDGDHLAAMLIPYDSAELTVNCVNYWRRGEVFTEHWNREQFVSWVETLIDQGLIRSINEMTHQDDPPESLSLHFVPFAQGMLYVGSVEPLEQNQIDLVQAVADTFAVAYARYEDFQKLEVKNEELATTLNFLAAAQEKLIQSEKMASLGQLTAGIAHEIKNPLNFINNFARLCMDMTEEIKEELTVDKEKSFAEVLDEVDELLDILALNASKIREHGERIDSIVRGMMKHANGGVGEKQTVVIDALLDEYINLAYHGMRARVSDFNVTIERNYSDNASQIKMVPQEIGQVLINLFNNAFDAMQEKQANSSGNYDPLLRIETAMNGNYAAISVIDNGPGIPDQVRDKVFEPFFTTKPAGIGTGLGLSLSHDIIVKGHSGKLYATNNHLGGTTFTIELPV